MMRALLVVYFSTLLTFVLGQDEYHTDPYLKFRPPFSRSLPVQVLLTGIVLTLVSVLFIHLIFTAQYHWPLAPVNYVLQLSGVTTLLISKIATIHVVLSAAFDESEKWPYMLSYIAVSVPPLDSNDDSWSVAERATWLLMNASTSGLIQITHIQFLTLLYPSRLEARLIFALLGPLAIVAALMQLLPISGSDAVNNVASAVRNVCNATLSLLFTLSLFFWGLLVNRKQAWRTDGGTAIFGCAALSLAVVSTALNFLYVHKEEEFIWLPGLMWSVVLWQSFLSWWWWVGAGSVGALRTEEYEYSEESVAEKIKREAKRQARRKQAKERRKETKIKAKKVWQDVADAITPTSSSGQSLMRRRMPKRTENRESSPPKSTRSTSPSMPRTTPLSFATSLPKLLPGMIYRWFASLRRAHNAAARVQAAERVERIREMAGEGRGDGGERGMDWNLGWRRSLRPRLKVAGHGFGTAGQLQEEGFEMRNYDRKAFDSKLDKELDQNPEPDDDEDLLDDICISDHEQHEQHDRENESTLKLRSKCMPSRPLLARPPPVTRLHQPPSPAAAQAPPSRSVWWWGPLWRWRLQDSTVYR